MAAPRPAGGRNAQLLRQDACGGGCRVADAAVPGMRGLPCLHCLPYPKGPTGPRAAHIQWWSTRAMHLRARRCMAGARKGVGIDAVSINRGRWSQSRHAGCRQRAQMESAVWTARHAPKSAPPAPAKAAGPHRRRPPTPFLGAAHLLHTRQCLERAGRGSWQVLQCFSGYHSPSGGYSAACAAALLGVMVPGSASPAARKRARHSSAAAVPVYLQAAGRRQPGARQAVSWRRRGLNHPCCVDRFGTSCPRKLALAGSPTKAAQPSLVPGW